MDADFNTPDALAVIFDLAREINTLRARDSAATSAPPAHDDLDRRRRTLVYLLGVLGLDLSAAEPSEAASVGPLVELTLDIRGKLRDIKQWALADEIRDRLNELGIIVEDKPGGESTWRRDR
jgi:cysteinyl-tRNA synthetase